MHPDNVFVMQTRSTITFRCPVPYRVTQKQQSPLSCVMLVRATNRMDAPAVLVINQNTSFIVPHISNPMVDLHIHDEVFVHNFQVMDVYVRPSDASASVTAKLSTFGNLSIEPLGFVLNGTVGEICSTWSELAFVIRVENDVVFIADPNTVQETPLPIDMAKNIITGDLLRIHYALHPKGTAISAQNDYAGHPDTLAAFQPTLCSILETEVRFATCVKPVPHIIEYDELSQYYIACVAALEVSHRHKNFHRNSIGPVQLVWNTRKPCHTQVIYCVDQDLPTKENVFHGSNILHFRQGSIAALKRVTPGVVVESCLIPFYVRITSAIYKADRTLISFIVDANALVSTWNLSSIDDLPLGLYRLDPLTTFYHLRDFTAKLASDKQYIQRKLTENVKTASILRTFLPFPLPTRSPNLTRSKTYSKERKFDSTLESGAFTCAQFAAIESVVNNEPLVLIEGGVRMGKTETAVHIIPGVLQELVVSFEKSESPKCLVVASSHPSLQILTNKVAETSSFEELVASGVIRTLNLFDFSSPKSLGIDGLLTVIERLMVESTLKVTEEEKETLQKVREIFGSRLGSKVGTNGSSTGYSSGQQSEDGQIVCHSPLLTSAISNLEIEEFEFIDASAIDQNDHLTSTELSTFQTCLKIIISRYMPNFIIAPTNLLISMLPVLGNVITHLVLDEAGLIYAIDAIAIVTETRKLEQLVLIGDRIHFPDDYYSRLKRSPKCLISALRCVQEQAAPVVHHILRKPFHLHTEIVSVLAHIFYPNRIIEPLVYANGLNLDNVFGGNPNVPIYFLDVTSNDPPVFPVVRNNSEQSGVAIFTASRILSQNPGAMITILCYYTSQVKCLLDYVRSQNLPIEVTTVDAFHGRTTDVVIVITTRTLGERCNFFQHKQGFRDGEVCLQRMPSNIEEINEELDQRVFQPQRMLTAMSRGERAVFIIGSAKFLSKNFHWARLFDRVQLHGNFVENLKLTQGNT